MRAFVSTIPFGEKNRDPLDLLENANVQYQINPLERRLSEEELAQLIPSFDLLIAGTEPITRSVLENAPRLKLIARVGIGLDSVDLNEARSRNISVSYTPDAPSPAVAELTIGLMLSSLRKIAISNEGLHQGKWQRYFGNRLSEAVVGIIGAGRIGKRVIHHLAGFGCKKILVNDLIQSDLGTNDRAYCWASKEQIYREANIISVHVPLTGETRHMIGTDEIQMMQANALLINTARGGIINEESLYKLMADGHLGGAAIDVFESEPYSGPLREIDRCLLTAHMGSMTEDCRARMEIEAAEEIVRFASGEPLQHIVPDYEYAIQAHMSKV